MLDLTKELIDNQGIKHILVAYTGIAIVTKSSSGQLYFWHRDGTNNEKSVFVSLILSNRLEKTVKDLVPGDILINDGGINVDMVIEYISHDIIICKSTSEWYKHTYIFNKELKILGYLYEDDLVSYKDLHWVKLKFKIKQ